MQFSDLTFKQQIGDGSVGRVHLGKWQVDSLPHCFRPCSCLLQLECLLHHHWRLCRCSTGDSRASPPDDATSHVQETDVAIKMLSSLAAIGIHAPTSNRTSHDKMMRTLEHEVMCQQCHTIKQLPVAHSWGYVSVP